ncbi:fumarylacetoacetate hydrolase family protein [Sphingomonas sp. LT1P40]|uniref:fumarylacetoacetate hydrolase family protein n=1 Tax=Alteristakelama amylovorans TaxID=3096166 RepID=UPI002FC7B606
MKLATLRTGGDGRLLIVSRDLQRGTFALGATTLQAALDDWGRVAPMLREQAGQLEAATEEGVAVDPAALDAVLPRGFQFLDASAFLAHNHILADAWGFEKRGEHEPPLMYQGISHRYFSPHEDVAFVNAAHDVDFEAEIGIITDAVPMGVTPDAALAHVKLIVIINDWSLRAFGPGEMKGGFGFIHAKPPSTLSAFALTPDELGDAWHGGRVHQPLSVWRGEALFGAPQGGAMHFGFGELIAHAAATRDLCAGTVIGSGTVSNYDAETVGSGCIAERRALDTIAGRPVTPYLADGERVRLSLGDPGLLGVIDQRVRVAMP